MGAGWYVARTKPRKESLAAAELIREGIEVFFPTVKIGKPWAGQPSTPLFPGYLFLQCDPESQGWPSFSQAYQITGWVHFGEEIPSLPDKFIDALKATCQTNSHEGGLGGQILTGEKVLLLLEVLAKSLEDSHLHNASVESLLHLIGGKVMAQAPWWNLRSVEGQEARDKTAYYEITAKAHVRRGTRGRNRWVKYPGTGAT